jgi:hypothetical protein
MPRIKPVEAMEHLSLKRDSFRNWCKSIKLKAHKYESSNRTYYFTGEFYAKADYDEILKIKEIHGDRWCDFYPKAVDVNPYLPTHEQEDEPQFGYTPISKEVQEFRNKLFNEEP